MSLHGIAWPFSAAFSYFRIFPENRRRTYKRAPADRIRTVNGKSTSNSQWRPSRSVNGLESGKRL
jgi:hypothetical protein